VLDDDGRFVGFTVVSETYPSLQELLRRAVPELLLFLGLGALLGLLGSYLLSRLVRRGTRGLEPREIATLADHREALLYSIREGVVGTGADGTLTVLNDSARELLRLGADSVGRPLAELDLAPAVRDVLMSEGDVVDAVVAVGDRVLVLNRRVASARGERIGTVTTLRDRTELVALQSRLAATSSVTQTLRAQSHEFANQLHTISGLVQLGEYDDVGGFIGELTRRRARISDAVTRAVDDPTVAGLLVAKASLAAESGVALDVDPASRMQRLPPDVAADVTTVLGNLVDNALDATSAIPDARVRVLLRDEGDVLLVEVADSGPGVPEGVADRIFERGFSTKPADASGRGVGLALVQVVCARRGGGIEVGEDVAGGAVFRARIPHGVPEAVR
jgi:sensor histidine kinase regulating citrate/malate metabolism